MAKLRIYTFPDDVLSKRAEPIVHVERTYFKLADDMLETMYEAPGIGLAANQVGILERILVIDTDYELKDAPEGAPRPAGFEVTGNGEIIQHKKPIILINPEIIYKEGKTSIEEGCLSVPDYTSEVQRARKIKVQYKDIDGVTRILDAEDLQAVCIQHELDHLEGKLFIDRLSPLKKELAKKKLIKQRFGSGK